MACTPNPFTAITCVDDLDPEAFDVEGRRQDDVAHDHLLKAGRAASAAKTYADRGSFKGAEVDWVIADLLISLQHLADTLDLDFNEILAEARRAYRQDMARAS
jgi:hypothetical protein